MLQINDTRLLARIKALAQIGSSADGGISRPAFSEADVAGRAWFHEQVEEAGLVFRSDGAGNLSALLPSTHPNARTLLAGSHLDTVPNGGRFDGALGVLCALEALQTIKGADLAPKHHLEAISFTDEEGAFIGTFGSLAMCGFLSAADLERGRLDPAQLDAGLQRLGLTRQGLLSARRQPASLLGFVEIHIEQGSRLEDAQLNIGIVTAIVGIRSFWLRFIGRAAHAGTEPMRARSDALWGAARYVSQASDMVIHRFSPGVMNCGQLHVLPGSFNIVPAEVQLALEFRHSSEEMMNEMEAALLSLAEQTATTHHLHLEVEALKSTAPAEMDADMMRTVEQAAERLGLSSIRLPSLAGHDARSLSQITPTTLIFVPCAGGISHNPGEYAGDEDVINGANVLLQTLLDLVNAEGGH